MFSLDPFQNSEQVSLAVPDIGSLHGILSFAHVEVKGVVVLVHGVAGHMGRYGHVIDAFNRRGYHVFIYDQRGHGRSSGRRGHVDSFQDYSRDLGLALSRARTLKLPVFVVGFGTGALVTLMHLWQRPSAPGVNAAVLVGTPVTPLLHWPRAQELSGRLWGRMFSTFSVKSLIDGKRLSKRTATVANFNNDPLVLHRLTLGWYVSFLNAVHELRSLAPEAARALEVSALFLHGGQDQIADPEGSRDMFQRYPYERKSLNILWEHGHEILNEDGFDDVVNEIQDWFDASLDEHRVRGWLVRPVNI